jgi:hypothetical protein
MKIRFSGQSLDGISKIDDATQRGIPQHGKGSGGHKTTIAGNAGGFSLIYQ